MANRWVIDASIARAAGEKPDGISRVSREVLELVFERKEKVISFRELRDEWRRHRSNYFTKWMAIAISKKFVEFIELDEKSSVARNMDEAQLGAVDFAVMIKDCHLCDGAIESRGIITSHDDNARDAFKRHSKSLVSVKGIVWLSPMKDDMTSKNIDSTRWIRSRTL